MKIGCCLHCPRPNIQSTQPFPTTVSTSAQNRTEEVEGVLALSPLWRSSIVPSIHFLKQHNAFHRHPQIDQERQRGSKLLYKKGMFKSNAFPEFACHYMTREYSFYSLVVRWPSSQGTHQLRLIPVNGFTWHMSLGTQSPDKLPAQSHLRQEIH